MFVLYFLKIIIFFILNDPRVTFENIRHSFLLRGSLIMKTTVSYFPGMLKNLVPAVKKVVREIIIQKDKKYYEISTLYECVEKIDDYRL